MFRLQTIRNSIVGDIPIGEQTEKLIRYCGRSIGIYETHELYEGTYIINGVRMGFYFPTNRLYFYEGDFVFSTDASEDYLSEDHIFKKCMRLQGAEI